MDSRFPADLDRVLTVIGTAGVGGLLIGILRGVIQQRHGGILRWLSMLAASVTVGTLVGLAIEDMALSPTTRYAIVCTTAYFAEDVLIGLGAIFSLFARDPFAALKALRRGHHDKESDDARPRD